MSTTIGGVTVTDPSECTEYEVSAGFTQRRLANNNLVTDYVGSPKKGWRVRWGLLTETQKDTLKAETDDPASQSFSPPDETATYTVQVMRGAWEEVYIKMGSASEVARYNCNITLEEV